MNRPKSASVVIQGTPAAGGCYSEINGLGELHDPAALALHALFSRLDV
ncbi:hypothetical protein [Pseudomonas putida]